jgi:cytochrome b pre-mRNA-processing protein 3
VLSRNIFDGASGSHVVALAAYLMAEDRALAAQPTQVITGGNLNFEDAA